MLKKRSEVMASVRGWKNYPASINDISVALAAAGLPFSIDDIDDDLDSAKVRQDSKSEKAKRQKISNSVADMKILAKHTKKDSP